MRGHGDGEVGDGHAGVGAVPADAGGPGPSSGPRTDRGPSDRMTSPPWLGAGAVPPPPAIGGPPDVTDARRPAGPGTAGGDARAGLRRSRIVLDAGDRTGPGDGDEPPGRRPAGPVDDGTGLGRLALGAALAGQLDPVPGADATSGRRDAGAVDPGVAGPAGRGPVVPRNRTVLVTALALGGLMVLLTFGALGYRVASGDSSPAVTAAGPPSAAAVSAPTGGGDPDPGSAPAAPPTHCPVVVEPDHLVGDGPGTLDHPAGVVLAFNHAYYVERSVERAFEAVAPSSALDRDILLREGISRLAPGTSHCVDARVVDDRHVAVVLTERPPGAEPVVFHQRIRVEPLTEGRWGIVAITPAG